MTAEGNRGRHAGRPAEVRQVMTLLDDYWADAYPAMTGDSLVDPTFVVFDSPTSTGGAAWPSPGRPFYCPGDQKIYVDLGFCSSSSSSASGATSPWPTSSPTSTATTSRTSGHLGGSQSNEQSVRRARPTAARGVGSRQGRRSAQTLDGPSPRSRRRRRDPGRRRRPRHLHPARRPASAGSAGASTPPTRHLPPAPDRPAPPPPPAPHRATLSEVRNAQFRQGWITPRTCHTAEDVGHGLWDDIAKHAASTTGWSPSMTCRAGPRSQVQRWRAGRLESCGTAPRGRRSLLVRLLVLAAIEECGRDLGVAPLGGCAHGLRRGPGRARRVWLQPVSVPSVAPRSCTEALIGSPSNVGARFVPLAANVVRPGGRRRPIVCFECSTVR